MQIDRPILIAVMLFILVIFVFFLVMPEYKTFNKLQADLGIKKAQYVAESEYYAMISKIYFDLQSRQDDLQKVDDALPQDPTLGKTVFFLQLSAKQSGVVLKNLFLSKSSQGSNASAKKPAVNATAMVRDLVFSLDVISDYSSLGRFISLLEKTSRIFEITSISFGSGSSSEDFAAGPNSAQFQAQQTYNFTIQIKTHTY